MQSWLPELCCRLCHRSELRTVQELQSICWTWLHLIRKMDQMTQKITIKLTLGLKMDIFIVFMVIENIPDLKIWLLSGIWLSSGDLLSIEFSLFFGLFLEFFLCFCYKKVFYFISYWLQGFSASFDVTFHNLIATRRAIIYGHTWGLDQQKYFFERQTMEF